MRRINLKNVQGAGQLFTEKDKYGKLIIIIAKTVDELYMAGTSEAIDVLLKKMKDILEVGKIQKGSPMTFNGCEFTIDDEGTTTI